MHCFTFPRAYVFGINTGILSPLTVSTNRALTVANLCKVPSSTPSIAQVPPLSLPAGLATAAVAGSECVFYATNL